MFVGIDYSNNCQVSSKIILDNDVEDANIKDVDEDTKHDSGETSKKKHLVIVIIISC